MSKQTTTSGTGTIGMRAAALLLAASATLAGVGCDKTSSSTATPPNSGTGMTGINDGGKQITGPVDTAAAKGAGGAPAYGEATGTGFASGDAVHSGGQGSGLMGYHGTGAMGTSEAISDRHDAGKAPADAPKWVLPAQ